MINYYKQTLILFFVLFSTSLFSQNEFITHWSSPVDTLITIKTKATSGPYNYTVSWQSLTTPSFNGSASAQTTDYQILNVPDGDTIEVKISGVFPHFYMKFGDQRNYLTKVTQWGDNQWQNMSWAFEGCEKLILTATDTPDLTAVTSMEGMFSGCKMFNQSINNWDVSNVTNMNDLFSSDSLFNQPLNTWNVTNVTEMNDIFSGALKFNQPLNTWNVANVTSMKMVFAGAVSFNQPLANWNVSQVTNMYGMFNEAILFNQPLNSWNVSNVMSMEQMFLNATAFNQPIGTWSVSNVERMNEMFKNAISFNQSLDSWDVSSVEYMYEMFRGATAFNMPVNNWDVSNVTTMDKMFFGATAFDQAFNNWDISNIMNLNDMLSGATSLSYCHYDDALIAWKALPVVPTSINLGALGVKYSATGQSARNLLITFHGWTITDGGTTVGVDVQVTANNNNFCVGNTTSLNVTSNLGGTTFSWNQSLPPLTSHTVTPNTTTTYVVTGTDGIGCKNSDSVKIVVNQLPLVNLVANQLAICEKDTVFLTASGGDIYLWNEGLIPVASNEAIPAVSTQYIVIGIDANGCENSDTVFVTVNLLPNVNLQATPAAICIGESSNLTATGATTYTWNQGLTPGATKTVSPIVTTKYIIKGTDANGCKNTDTLKIIVNELPVVTLQSNKMIICKGLPATLIASGANTYSWNNGLTAGANKTVSPTTSTEYIVVGTDVNGCKSSDSLFITVEECLGVENLENDLVHIYPNPASDNITIKGEGLTASYKTIYILDVTGKTVFVSPISQLEEIISVSELNNGMYFIHLVGTQNKTYKVEVKH